MTGEPARGSRDVERTRQLILDAARDTFAARGYDATSIRDVARKAGLSHGTIYLHFRDKDDLLYQVSEDEFARLLTRLRSLPRSQDPIQRLIAATRAIGRFGLDYPHQYGLLIGQRPAASPDGQPPGLSPVAELMMGFLGDLAREAAKRGFIPTPISRLDELVLLAATHGTVAMFGLRLIDRQTAEQAIDHAATLMAASLTGGTCEVQLPPSNS